jgi:hypothetical protein
MVAAQGLEPVPQILTLYLSIIYKGKNSLVDIWWTLSELF